MVTKPTDKTSDDKVPSQEYNWLVDLIDGTGVDAHIKTIDKMECNTFKVTDSPTTGHILTSDADGDATWQANASSASSGSGVPISTPTVIGALYVDTTNNKAYIAMGTSSSADWKKILTQ